MNNPFFDNIERYPMEVIAAGHGAELVGVDNEGTGRIWLDFWSDESTQGGGYDLSEMLREFAASAIPHQLPDIYPNDVRTRLANRLLETYGFNKVFFGNSGADAIETAIKIARKYQWKKGNGKRLLYTLKGNFHGRSLGALGLSDSIGSGSPYHKRGFATNPVDSSLHLEGKSWQGYGVIDETLPLESQVDLEHAAAIFMAPILGNNVVKGYDPAFLRELREFCTKHDILLVFDEIQTGSGWTGHYSAAQMYGVQPDMMTLGKRIAYGFPMSATLASERLAETIGLGEHFNTFAGSPFVCWFADKWLDFLGSGGLAEIAEKGAEINNQLWAIPSIKKVNRYGMMISFLPDYERLGRNGREICKEAFDHDLLIVTHRPDGEIRFTPPIAVTYEQINRACAVLRSILAD